MDRNEREWERIKNWLPKGYVWGKQMAKRISEKRRAMGEMVMDIRKELIDREERIKTIEERIMERKIKRGREKWRIVRVYVNEGIKKTLERLGEWMKEERIQ